MFTKESLQNTFNFHNIEGIFIDSSPACPLAEHDAITTIIVTFSQFRVNYILLLIG